MFHSDQKTSSQAAYSVGTDGTEGRRIARRTEPEPEAGEPQVSSNSFLLVVIPGIDETIRHNTVRGENRHFISNHKHVSV